MVRFACTKCGKEITVDDKYAGRKGKCKQCGTTLYVPAPNKILDQTKQSSIQDTTSQAQSREPLPVTQRKYTTPSDVPGHDPQAPTVNVNIPYRSSSFGIASLVLGIIAFILCWIPLVGCITFPVSALGLILGITGLIIAIKRKGGGIAYPIAGSALSSIALTIIIMTYLIGTAVNETSKAIDEAIAEIDTNINTAFPSNDEPAITKDSQPTRDKAQYLLSRFFVERARFYYSKGGFMEEAVIDLSVRNNGDQAVSRAYFHGVLITPGRSIPWVKENFNYEIPGGLEPGESANWKLSPNMFGEWSKAPKDRDDMVLKVTVTRLDGPDGKPIADIRE